MENTTYKKEIKGKDQGRKRPKALRGDRASLDPSNNLQPEYPLNK